MEEFTISFYYQNKDQKAGVIWTDKGKEIEYNVRPIAPDIVKTFGKQIKIFRKGQIYTIQHHLAPEDKVFYTALIRAIRLQEHGRSDAPIKIRIKRKYTTKKPEEGLSPEGDTFYLGEDDQS